MCSQAVARSTGFHLTWSKAFPLTRTAQTVRASLLSSASTITLYGRLSSSLTIQPLRWLLAICTTLARAPNVSQ